MLDGHRWHPKKVLEQGRNCLDCGMPIALFAVNAPCAGTLGL